MTKSPRHFLYCIRFKGGEIARVGSTDNPRARIFRLAMTAPFEMEFRHMLELPSRATAAAWETLILSKANRYRGSGEWVACDTSLDDLFASVTPFVDVRAEFSDKLPRGRSVARAEAAEERLAQAKMVDRFGIGAKRVIPARKNVLGDEARSIIHARLSNGYGADDCRALDGIPTVEFWSEVERLRKSGALRRLIGVRAKVLAAEYPCRPRMFRTGPLKN